MNLSNYLKTWEGMLSENHWNRFVTAGILIPLIILAFKSLSTETVVTIQPMTLTEEAWVSRSKASASYHEAWGLFLAQLVGNTTPDTTDFLKERIGPLLSPSIYQEVLTAIDQQSASIKQDRVSMSFRPRSVLYESSSGRVFVYGESQLIDVSGNTEKKEATYEFELSIDRYMPRIVDIKTYEGKPRTTGVMEKMERKKK